ncbi:MAG: carbohydrate ABC transporter permease [Aristaeellaceae bacterium]
MSNTIASRQKISISLGDRMLTLCFYLFITLFAVFALVPFLLVLSASFTDEITLNRFGYQLWPKAFSLDAYRLALQDGGIGQAYIITVFTTVVGTFGSMVMSCLAAYAMSVKTFRSRGAMAMFIYFTMLFNGGLVPSYLLITKFLKLQNSILVLLLPSLCNAWNILLLRNFFNSVPDSLREAAKVDGASDLRILVQIILPVSLPAIATIGLFYALSYWNEWYKCLLYIDTTHKNLYTLQYLIQRILRQVNYAANLPAEAAALQGSLPTYSFRMAAIMLAIGPIVLLYPFLQKYFVAGLTVGAVKG